MFTAGVEESYNALTGQGGVTAQDCEMVICSTPQVVQQETLQQTLQI